jgi:hypothetical protein
MQRDEKTNPQCERYVTENNVGGNVSFSRKEQKKTNKKAVEKVQEKRALDKYHNKKVGKKKLPNETL